MESAGLRTYPVGHLQQGVPPPVLQANQQSQVFRPLWKAGQGEQISPLTVVCSKGQGATVEKALLLDSSSQNSFTGGVC